MKTAVDSFHIKFDKFVQLFQEKILKKSIWKNRPKILMQQRESDCGAACFGSVLKFYGVKKINLSAIHELLKTGRDGSSFEQLKDAFQQVGIKAQPFETSLSSLKRRYTSGGNHPAILHWKGNHFVVLYNLDKSGALIADPAAGIYKIKYDEFNEKWTKYALLIEKTAKFSPPELQFKSPNPWHKFKPIILSLKSVFASVFILAIILQLISLVHPLAMKYLFDNLLSTAEARLIDLVIGSLLLVIAFQAIIEFIRSFILVKAEQKLSVSMKDVFYEHLFKLPASYFNRQRTGDLITLNADTKTIGSLLVGQTLVTTLDLLTFITYFGLLLYLQIKLVMLALCIIPFYAVSVFISAKFLQRLHRVNFARASELQSYTVENLGGMLTIKALAIENSISQKLVRLLISLQENQIKTAKVSLISNGINGLFMMGGQTLVFWYGVRLVINGELSVGSLVAFIAILGGLLRPAGSLIGLWNGIQQARLASERLGTFFEAKPEWNSDANNNSSPKIIPSSVMDNSDGDISRALTNQKPPEVKIDNVCYKYYGANKFEPPVLSKVCFTFERGKIYGIAGPSGSGKSTLAQLLVRFDDPTEGHIYFDDKNLRSIDPRELRRRAIYMPQDVYLFNTSIRENISCGNPCVTEEEIRLAAKLANADEFIDEMPRGYETILSERGMGLSGGQRQRIALARMLCRKPNMLILDEATSSLDQTSEAAIYSNLKTFFAARTVVIISHREETLENCDHVLYLNQGCLARVLAPGFGEQRKRKTGGADFKK